MKNNNGEVIYKQLDCSPCFKNSCPLSEKDNLKCLKSITVDEISKKAQTYLNNSINTIIYMNYLNKNIITKTFNIKDIYAYMS